MPSSRAIAASSEVGSLNWATAARLHDAQRAHLRDLHGDFCHPSREVRLIGRGEILERQHGNAVSGVSRRSRRRHRRCRAATERKPADKRRGDYRGGDKAADHDMPPGSGRRGCRGRFAVLAAARRRTGCWIVNGDRVESEHQITCRLHPLDGVFFQAPLDQTRERDGHIGQRPKIARLGAQRGVQPVDRRLALERAPAGEHLVEHAPNEKMSAR